MSSLVSELVRAQQVHLVNQEMDNDRTAREPGIGLTDMQTLHLLLRPDVRSPRDVARATGMPSSTVTDVVDRMVRAGFLERRQDERDRRKVLLSLTGRCQQAVDRYASSGLGGQMEQVVAEFSEDEPRTVLRCFQTLNERRTSAA